MKIITRQERNIIILLASCLLIGLFVRTIKEIFFNDGQENIKLISVSDEINSLYDAPGDLFTGNNTEPVQININTADVTELTTLPGIGPATAQKILAERERQGKFFKPEDLTEVKGIGSKTLSKLLPYISL